MKYMQSILLAFLVCFSTNVVLADNTKIDTKANLETARKAKETAKVAAKVAQDAYTTALKAAIEKHKDDVDFKKLSNKEEQVKFLISKDAAFSDAANDKKIKDNVLEEETKKDLAAWNAHHTYRAAIAAAFTGVVFGKYAIDYFKAEGKTAVALKYGSAVLATFAAGYAIYKTYDYFTADEDEDEDLD